MSPELPGQQKSDPVDSADLFLITDLLYILQVGRPLWQQRWTPVPSFLTYDVPVGRK